MSRHRSSSLLLLPLLALALLGAVPAHGAGWGSSVAIPGANATIGDRATFLAFGPGGNGVAGWGTNVSLTSDGGGSWGAASNLLYTPAFALDGAGNRVYVYRSGSFLRIVRTGPGGAPTVSTFARVPANNAAVWSLAVNPAGDVLVAWVSANTLDETAILFWAHDQADPASTQLMPTIPGASNATPFAVLDPDRHAVVAYQQDGHLVQVESANAASAPFGAPTTISGGQVGGMRGAQAPDGRAAIAWYETSPQPANQYSSTTRFDLYAAIRGPARAFGAPQHVDGSADVVAGYSGNNEVAIAPNGRAVVGYGTQRNRGVSVPCATTLGESRTMVALGTIDADGRGGFGAPQQLAGGGGVDSYLPRVAAGPDGRLAASWRAVAGCGNAEDLKAPGVAFAEPRGSFAPVPAAPLAIGALGFLPDGRLAGVASPNMALSGPLSTVVYDPGVPLDGGGSGGSGGGAGGSGGPRAPATAARARLTAVAVDRRGGTLTVTLKVPAAGRVLLEALARRALLVRRGRRARRGTVRVASASATVRGARTVRLTLRPTGTARTKLRAAGKLSVTLRVTFKPASGRAPAPTTRSATFRYAPPPRRHHR